MRINRYHGELMIIEEYKLIRKAEYMDIILSLLSKPYNIRSITKITFFSFCVQHMTKFNSKKNNMVDKFFSSISLSFFLNYSELEDIFWVLDLLKKTRIIEVVDDNISFVEDFNFEINNKTLLALMKRKINPILELNKLDADAVIEEVVRYV